MIAKAPGSTPAAASNDPHQISSSRFVNPAGVDLRLGYSVDLTALVKRKMAEFSSEEKSTTAPLDTRSARVHPGGAESWADVSRNQSAS